MIIFVCLSHAASHLLPVPSFSYKPAGSGAAPKKVALVGKGLTFDSGGYNIKAGAG